MPPSPRDVLAAYHRAMLAWSADDLANLYAPHAIHEFPFLAPGRPSRYHGREEVRAGYQAAWGATSVRLQEIHDIAVFDSTDPEVVIGQWGATATLEPGAAPAAITGLLILRVRDGLIVHALDYMDSLGTFHALGRLPALLDNLNTSGRDQS
ncbi:nuclear transport factor 2 family protein [Streptomyces noursei]|uniref:nuclear transport factor 2 family protein n=1 Tax=Streptomyces noursei TaxID=1971 RepID=UPI001674BBC6|nr:nuclear transport factor 2 family protein [Streptomyces noursei]MCZ1012977.1 nuclear transport factor 2 family protein [Streptomyces noursei]